MSRSPTQTLLAIADRLYRVLLLLYPPGFRRAHGLEMTQVFRTACRELVREAGLRALLPLWLHTLRDLTASATLEWVALSRQRHILGRSGRLLLHWGRVAFTALSLLALLGIATLLYQNSSSIPRALPQPFVTPVPSPYQQAVTELQSQELTPVTGTSTMSALAAPNQGIMPPDATLDIGLRRTDARWSVRDRTHYRVVLHRVAPAIDSGAITIVANGRTVKTYDDRTNTASIVYLRAPPHQTLPATAPSLTSLIGWSRLLPPDVVPNPSQPLRLLERTIMQTPFATVRMVGHARLLGRRTDVFDLRPLYTFVWSTCKPPSPTGCPKPIQHQRGFGWGRLWLDRKNPFMLRDLEAGVPLRARLVPQRYQFRVLSVTYGQGPSNAELRYRPPIKPVRVDYWCLGCRDVGGWTSWPARQFPGFYDVPRPRGSFGRALPRMQVFDESDSPVPRPSGVDILYSTGRHHDYYHPRDLQQIYALGPYIYIRERLQRNGLPAGLRRGTLHVSGACRMWTGSYHDDHHWLDLARGPISFFLYSNALSERALAQYAANRICSASPS